MTKKVDKKVKENTKMMTEKGRKGHMLTGWGRSRPDGTGEQRK